MKGDVFVELYDAIERRLSCQRYKGTTHWKDQYTDVEMEHEGSSSSYWVGETKRGTCGREVVLELIVEETECSYHQLDGHKN